MNFKKKLEKNRILINKKQKFLKKGSTVYNNVRRKIS